MISKVQDLSEEKLAAVKKMIGEAFVTNELFHNWGTVDERREDVMKYMAIYVDYVYRSGALYSNEELTAFIGLEDPSAAPVGPRLKMILKLMTSIKFSKIKSLLKFVKQIEGSNARYAKKPHIDALMVCVDKEHQGEGLATELIEFAKATADSKCVPLLFDTDMKDYSDMYEHFGCELYNTVTADNGVTRYSLVYNG
ncbi:Acetyltransferase (GNAT) domain-containing protein [Ruminococcaceae bacterium KH2T8]|nr:Acetyltransferase (GNAT) domain-containing protein [Ruminococcaceae bacterium KH2T8]